MSFKPCRGARILLDKAIESSHNNYFLFHEAKEMKEKTKIAFKWLKSEIYLNREKYFISFLGDEFLKECLTHKETYKPLLKYLNSTNHV